MPILDKKPSKTTIIWAMSVELSLRRVWVRKRAMPCQPLR
jgi:hypothetical protein